jgi:hypothetical protein
VGNWCRQATCGRRSTALSLRPAESGGVCLACVEIPSRGLSSTPMKPRVVGSAFGARASSTLPRCGPADVHPRRLKTGDPWT